MLYTITSRDTGNLAGLFPCNAKRDDTRRRPDLYLEYPNAEAQGSTDKYDDSKEVEAWKQRDEVLVACVKNVKHDRHSGGGSSDETETDCDHTVHMDNALYNILYSCHLGHDTCRDNDSNFRHTQSHTVSYASST